MTARVECRNVWKCYRRGGGMGIKEFLVGKKRKAGRFLREWALQEVSFEVGRGQALGIMGPNGSGKSTLLSVILGVIRPDRGDVLVNGRVASLLEIGAGFHPELTGRENVFLYGAILGMTLEEIRSQYEAIVEFSQLEAAIEFPLRTYSNGMITRLGFSIIIHTPADILLIDEVLAVGDAEFKKKCKDFLVSFKERGGNLVIVSHDLPSLISLCDVGLCLNEGRVVNRGPIAEAVTFYKHSVDKRKGDPTKPLAPKVAIQ